jgi:predicted glutamine amidotransferase
MYYLCRDCNRDRNAQPLTGLELTDNEQNSRQTVVLFASVPLSDEQWLPFREKQLIVAANGCIVN